ncbi:MAG TPA: polysaccharide deacetylase family protein [Patescibacteria group bacterium]|nr:polysaccharide deacetylase family protein [Patescibacteria group bacterium]
MSTAPSGFDGCNILTFDVEEWFHANYDQINPDDYRGKGSKFREHMDVLLQMCVDAGCQATFFVLGSVGEDYPDVVRAVARAGHEISSHGYGHQLAYRQTLAEFRQDVKRSVGILEDISGKRVQGYRAPSWSIMKSNLHYLEVLEEVGLQYDASIFPVKTFLYGIPDAPTEIHHPRINGRELKLWEIPTSVTKILGKNMGYSGGFYFRLFPRFFIERAIRAANKKGESAVVYLHPREIDSSERHLDLPLKESFIHYYNVGANRAKLADILRHYRFTSIARRLQNFTAV